ncbi:SDR family NAD(P)-dependent oxidoreductase [Leptolyngbya sp. CCNP1308]|uniref:SDR family NAD(P)-dependent oxidoreductase n=1 Tax=Leptolyngbya sp. CCNP1308 TaxID=3110255 RepID=UPI002B21528F|nr:SDR family NAD(P)-dependent oxidoreductase [Leptolyngbya sp. CCNP1308]MEA5449155.1 SDR family NAD(P)-dependent oxidoreductase [Leptolyngbya sp. CCNP1308]
MILQDKVALVTGGTSEIGRATAIADAQKQAKVVVVGRRRDEGKVGDKNKIVEYLDMLQTISEALANDNTMF